MLVGHGAGRAVLVRVEHADAIAHALRRMREHAAKLTAAEHAEPGAGQDWRAGVVDAELARDSGVWASER